MQKMVWGYNVLSVKWAMREPELWIRRNTVLTPFFVFLNQLRIEDCKGAKKKLS